MALITISPYQPFPDANGYSADHTQLRVWYSRPFVDSDGVTVQSGNGTQGFYIPVDCTIVSGVLTTSSFQIRTTVDAQDPNPQSIQCFAQLFSNGSPRAVVFGGDNTPTGWIIYNPDPLTTYTVEQLAFLNQSNYIVNPPVTYPTTQSMVEYVNSVTGASYATTARIGSVAISTTPSVVTFPTAVGVNDYAAVSHAGIIQLSVAPASSTSPIAVGKNDYASTSNLGLVKLSAAPVSASNPIAVAKTDNASITNAGVVTTTTSSPIVVSTDDTRIVNAADVTAANVFTNTTGQSMKKLLLPGSSSGTTTVQAASTGSPTFTLPSDTGTNGYVLQTNGSGVLTWTAQTGGGGGGSPGGSSTQLQYNAAGSFGGITGATTDGTAVTLTSPILVTPTLGVATATSINKVAITAPASSATLTIANSKTLTVSNTLTLAGTDSTVMTFPSTSATIARTDAGQTFTGVQTFSTAIAVTSGGTGTATQFTAGSIVFAGASGVYSQNNSKLFWDNNTQRLGLLTNTPSVTFDCGGDILVNAATANLYLKDTSTGFQSSSSTVITPQASNSIRSTNFQSGLVGWAINALDNIECNNLTARGAINASVLTYNSVNVTAGTLGVFKSGGKLKANCVIPSSPTYGTTTVNVDIEDSEGLSHVASQLFVVNDIIQLKGAVSTTSVGNTWLKVSSVSDQTTYWRYVCIIMAGSNNITYYAGLGVADYGQSGQGFIIETADASNSPYIQMATHAATFSSMDSGGTLVVTPQTRTGNLNGSYGYLADTYGFAAGQYGTASKAWVTVDQTNGFRAGSNTTTRINLAVDGSGYLANSSISWNTSGALTVSANATIAGWSITSTYMNSGTTYIASGFDAPAGAMTWFGKSVAGYQGWAARDSGGRQIAGIAGLGTVYPYLQVYDGTYQRVVIGGLNNSWNGQTPINSIGMEIWDSAGTKLVEFSDVQNVIAGWTVNSTYFAKDTGTDATSAGMAPSDYPFFAGATYANRASAPFKVTNAGALTATSATISGAITATSGSITGTLTMSGASSAIAIGSTPPTSAGSGTGIWLDRTGLYGLNSSTLQAKVSATDGSISSGGGVVVMDSTGIGITSTTGFSSTRAYRNLSGSTDISDWGGLVDASDNIGRLKVYQFGTRNSQLLLQTDADSSSLSTARLSALKGGAASAEISLEGNTGVTSFISGGSTQFTVGSGVVQFEVGPLFNSGGLRVGAATGGDKGTGTINVSVDIYKNNTAYTNPDYVFEHWANGKIEKFANKEGASQYAGLMPLDELRSYVKEHYTLPRFGQQAEHGVFSGADALLTTVEELYLHLFRLQDRINELESR